MSLERIEKIKELFDESKTMVVYDFLQDYYGETAYVTEEFKNNFAAFLAECNDELPMKKLLKMIDQTEEFNEEDKITLLGLLKEIYINNEVENLPGKHLEVNDKYKAIMQQLQEIETKFTNSITNSSDVENIVVALSELREGTLGLCKEIKGIADKEVELLFYFKNHILNCNMTSLAITKIKEIKGYQQLAKTSVTPPVRQGTSANSQASLPSSASPDGDFYNALVKVLLYHGKSNLSFDFMNQIDLHNISPHPQTKKVIPSEAIQAFFNDISIDQKTKKQLFDQLIVLASPSGKTNEKIEYSKKVVATLLNFPGYGLAMDSRVEELNKIVEEMLEAAKEGEDGPAEARKVLDEEIQRVKKLCEATESGAELIASSMLASYEQELLRMFEYRIKNDNFRKVNRNEQYPITKTPNHLALTGPPATGKTTACMEIAKIFKFGFHIINMQDMQSPNSISEITGLDPSYQGGGAFGLPASIRSQTSTKLETGEYLGPTRSVIVVFDETDRACSEAIGTVAGLLSEASKKDDFCKVDIPLDGMMCVATTNNYDNLPAHVKSRLNKVEFPGYDLDKKIQIILSLIQKKLSSLEEQKKILSNGLIQEGIIKEKKLLMELKENKELIKHLVENYSYDPGFRILRRALWALENKIHSDCLLPQRNAPVTIDEKYIDGCMSEANIKALTPLRRTINQLQAEFQKSLEASEKDPSSIFSQGTDLLEKINTLRKTENLEDDQTYDQYLSRIQSDAEYMVAQYGNKLAKKDLDPAKYIEQDQLSGRFKKFIAKKTFLKKQRDKKKVMLEGLTSTKKRDTQTISDINKQRILLEEELRVLDRRIKFYDAKIAIVNSIQLAGNYGLQDPGVIQKNLLEYREILQAEKSELELRTQANSGSDSLARDIKRIDKKIGNIDKLLGKFNEKAGQSRPPSPNENKGSSIQAIEDHNVPVGQTSLSSRNMDTLQQSEQLTDTTTDPLATIRRGTIQLKGLGEKQRQPSVQYEQKQQTQQMPPGSGQQLTTPTKGKTQTIPKKTTTPTTPHSEESITSVSGNRQWENFDIVNGRVEKKTDQVKLVEDNLDITEFQPITNEGEVNQLCVLLEKESDSDQFKPVKVGDPRKDVKFLISKDEENQTNLRASLSVLAESKDIVEKMVETMSLSSDGTQDEDKKSILISISDLCKEERSSKFNYWGIQACMSFKEVCDSKGLGGCKFDQDTIAYIQSLKDENKMNSLIEGLESDPKFTEKGEEELRKLKEDLKKDIDKLNTYIEDIENIEKKQAEQLATPRQVMAQETPSLRTRTNSASHGGRK